MIIWALILLAVLFAIPFAIELSRKQMDDTARISAPGEFAPLPQGVTHYQWTGPKDGPVAVCIHGLTTPSFVWSSTADGLAEQGFRVLTYDLFGRGYSDRAGGAQDQAFFLRQLNDLLEEQGVEGDLTVIGYSMGGIIATAFAANQPERIRDLVLLAPAGMKTAGFSMLRRISALPVLGEWLMLAVYPGILRRGLQAEANLETTVPGINDLQKAELDWRGFIPAVHSSIKNILTESFQPKHRTLKDAGVPVMAIWGRTDAVIPIESADLLLSWNPNVQTHIIDAGHEVTYTHTNDILNLIADFTKRHL